jgi:hypothetical protein
MHREEERKERRGRKLWRKSDRERKVREELKGINKMENGDKERQSKSEEK